jgi:hypothetical protein
MQEAHCHACQMTGLNKRMVLDVPRIDVKETPPGDAPLSSKSVCKSSKSVCACVCRYRASRKYILVPEVNVVASPPLLLLSPLLLIHPYPGLLKASTLSVGVSTCLLVGTPSFFLLSKKFWHS